MFEIIKPGTRIDFLSYTKYYFTVSIILTLIGVAVIMTKGFNYGIDFAGGTVIQAEFEQEPNLDDVRKAMNEIGMGEAVIQNFGDAHDVLIRIEKSERQLDEVSNDIKNTLVQTFSDGKVDIVRVEQVGPQVGEQLKTKAIYAVIYALIGMLIYIALRFKLVFAVGAVVSLFHDVIITLGIFSLMGKEINLTIVAALLTIVGYSINDTVIIFDRVREKMKTEADSSMSLKTVLNISLNETLSRTVLTSGTTLLAVLALFIFGGEVIHGFALALLVGIGFGTYSSICVAAALVYVIMNKKEAKAIA